MDFLSWAVKPEGGVDTSCSAWRAVSALCTVSEEEYHLSTPAASKVKRGECAVVYLRRLAPTSE